MMEKKEINISYDFFESKSDLSEDLQELVSIAKKSMGTAYAPYSNFNVGAAVRLVNGEVISGSNQENIAYPSGLCAERVALFYAGANYPDVPVDILCIVAEGDLVDKETLLSPCGACRQVMLEVENRFNRSYNVILVNQNGTVIRFNKAKDLLPLAFGS